MARKKFKRARNVCRVTLLNTQLILYVRICSFSSVVVFSKPVNKTSRKWLTRPSLKRSGLALKRDNTKSDNLRKTTEPEFCNIFHIMILPILPQNLANMKREHLILPSLMSFNNYYFSGILFHY